MINLIKKRREIFILLAYAILISCLGYFVIKPLIININTIRDDIQKESLIQEYKKIGISNLAKMKSQYEIIDENYDLANILLDKNNAIDLIEKLESLANRTENNIEISIAENQQQNVVKTSTQNKKGVVDNTDLILKSLPIKDYLQIKIDINGNYNSIIDFVDNLQKFEYYADVISLKIQKNNEILSNSTQRNIFYKENDKNNNSDNIEKKSKEGGVNASLDVVFYAKK